MFTNYTGDPPQWTRTETDTYRFSQYAPDPYILDWTSTHLPSAQRFFITDIDLILRDRAGGLMFVEIKRNGAKWKPHQSTTFAVLHNLVKAGLHYFQNVVPVKDQKFPITYYGFHGLTFERNTFTDGRIYWNGAEITEAEAIRRLSFQDKRLIVSKP